MNLPESYELKHKITSIATIVVVAILIFLPIYVLFIHDGSDKGTTIRRDENSIIPEMDYAETGAPDSVPGQPITGDTDPGQLPEDTPPIAEEVRPEPRPAEREPRPAQPVRVPVIAGVNSVDFPLTPENAGIRRTYRIRNDGNRTLEVRRISIEGEQRRAFTLAGSTSFTIEPNRYRDIEIEFLPGEAGTKTAVLSIESNDSRRSPYRVSLTGEGAESESVRNIVRSLYEEGRNYFEQRRFQNAEERYTSLLDLDPYNGPAYLMRGRSRYEKGEFTAALSDFDNVLKYRLSLPQEERSRIECITLYYAALSVTELAMRTENNVERQRLTIPALGRWEDFKGACPSDPTLSENADFWIQRLREPNLTGR